MLPKNPLTVVAAAVLALGLAACGGGSSTQTAMEPDPTPEPVEPAPPTDLETTQGAAAAAAAAAKVASDAATMAASGAADATANLATSQTGAMAGGHAMKASDYADMAMAEYMKAKAASDAAAAATLASAAGAALANAEAAQMAAEAAQEMAEAAAMMASEAAAMELMISGTMKSVGDSSVDAMSGPSSVATGSGDDAKTVVTGLIASMNPMGTSGPITGRAYTPATVDNLSTADDETEADGAVPATLSYRQAAAARTFPIGKTLDSSDDMARLMIVTHYAGTNTVRVFAPGDAATTETGTRAGYVTVDDQDTETTDTNNTALRSEGMFVPVTPTTAGTLVFGDEVADDAEAVAVYSYVPPTGATNAGVRQYATLSMTAADAGTGTTTYTYNTGADIVADAAAADGPDAGTDPDAAQVAVPIPGPEAYEHIHFGVWAALGDASASGAQDLSGMGIGFVQSIGDGMTGADMPNAGTVTYSGNWVAVVLQGAGDDSGALEHGAASLSANLDDAELTATLTGLATLEGAIDGSAFEGTMATAAANNTYGLTPGGDFEGSFSGGFYGAAAAEAGGIFDFSSEGNGAFRGAFGGVQDD